MPARALGAPQTTCERIAVTRIDAEHLQLVGIGMRRGARARCATRKPSSLRALDRPAPRPRARCALSVGGDISSADASVSRKVFQPFERELHGRRSHACGKGRLVEGGKAVMRQPAIASPSKKARRSSIPYFSMASRSTPTPQAKPCHSVGIEAGQFDHPAVDHAAAEQFHPAMVRRHRRRLPPTHPPPVRPVRIADIDLDAGFGEREIGRAQAQHDVVPLEEGLEEGFQRPFEMAEMNVRDRSQAPRPGGTSACAWRRCRCDRRGPAR